MTADMVSEGAVVIDVGTNRTDDGLVGDVDFDAVKEKAAAITPVPGGVGPMTIAMLLANTMRAARCRRLDAPRPDRLARMDLRRLALGEWIGGVAGAGAVRLAIPAVVPSRRGRRRWIQRAGRSFAVNDADPRAGWRSMALAAVVSHGDAAAAGCRRRRRRWSRSAALVAILWSGPRR